MSTSTAPGRVSQSHTTTSSSRGSEGGGGGSSGGLSSEVRSIMDNVVSPLLLS